MSLTLSAIVPSLVAASLSTAAIDLAVNVAVSVAESLIDVAVARLQAEATTLEATLPISSYYNKDENSAENGACLVFHNGDPETFKDATILMVGVLLASPDKTASKILVYKWQFARFFMQNDRQWFQ